MLEIDVVMEESFDEIKSEFVAGKAFKVKLEHSLFSLSKWESVWNEVFLSNKEKTEEQTLSYIKMMIVNDDIPPEVFSKLVDNHLGEVNDYVSATMTATTIKSSATAPQNRETVTAELIYYWMISLNIPVEFQHWHLNRLFTLMQVINLKSTPAKKMTSKERRDLNNARRAQYKTRG